MANARTLKVRNYGPEDEAELPSYGRLNAVTGREQVEVFGPGGSFPLGTTFAALAGEDLLAGQPIAINRISATLELADADAGVAKATCAGLVLFDTLTGFIAGVDMVSHTQADWTAVVGAVALLPGQAYFLSLIAGRLTTSAPTAPGQFVTYVGIAVSTTTLELDIQAPILL